MNLCYATQPTSVIPEKRDFPLNDKAKPCDDFHAYVCEKAEEGFKLRDDRSSHIFAFDDSDERILEKKKSFLKNIHKEKKLSPRSQQLKDYYLACMNKTVSIKEEKMLVKDLKSELAKVKTIEDFRKLNFDNLTNEKWSVLGYMIMPNIDNPDIYDITFDLDLMGLPEQSYYDDKALVEDYKKLIAEFMNVIYPKESKQDHLKRAQAVIDFEIKFKNTYPLPADFRKRSSEPRKISRADFLKETSVFDLKPFFDKNVPETTQIRDFIPESFQFMQKEFVQENLGVLKDMYLYRSARGFMDDAYPELFKKRWAFNHKYLGAPIKRPDRQERCTYAVMGTFNRELDFEMLPRLFPDFPTVKVLQVAQAIRESILKGIENNKWLSKDGKKEAYKKISEAKLQVVRPINDREWDFKEVLKLSPKSSHENAKQLAKASHERSFKRLKEGVNKEAWGMGPLTVNAYYSADKNKFVMPIGILQYPFFVEKGDITENLGAVGVIMAHELGHAIDDEGSKYDASGKLRQWMTDSDLENFKKRGEPLKQQFNKIGHNGELTQGENIADLVGVTFAYQAAFPGGEPKLEDQKKFFVAYARLWCGTMRDKTKEMLLKTDPHSLGYARINEQMMQQPGFQKAFQCKPGDKLYLSPEQQIKIW